MRPGSLKGKLLMMVLLILVNNVEAQTMQYLSSDYAEVREVKDHLVALMRIRIMTTGAGDPLYLTRIHLKTKKLKEKFPEEGLMIYGTGEDSSFSRSNLSQAGYAGSVTKIDRSFGVSISHKLGQGSNYFWICFQKDQVEKGPAFSAPDLAFINLGRQQFHQVWADEFNADTINTNNWGFENGFVRNREVQWYQKENAASANGILTIEAKRERKPNPDYVAGSPDWRKNREFIEYTSTSMRTSGKRSWLYGRFEMRARIDTASGYWPAWWTLGVTKRWPSNGEIDIMEFYRGMILANYAVGTARPSTAHWFTVTKPVSSFPDPHWRDRFHVWRMDWDHDGISIYVDDLLLNYQPQSNLYNRDSSGFYPFRQPHYMLLNLAIGGDNGGDPQHSTFPQKYEVDYVRVAQATGSFIPAGIFQPAKHVLGQQLKAEPIKLKQNKSTTTSNSGT